MDVKSRQMQIVAGLDGNLWFTEYGTGEVGTITTTGTITEHKLLAEGSKPEGIAVGPNNSIWFANYGAGKIGEIVP